MTKNTIGPRGRKLPFDFKVCMFAGLNVMAAESDEPQLQHFANMECDMFSMDM